MAEVHGRQTVIIFNGVDISAFCDNSNLDREADEHDVTTYGANSHKVRGGLLGGKTGIEGTYDNGASGPHDVINPVLGQVVTLVRRGEGTGAGKPQQTVSVHVRRYVETNPVADYVKWAAELTLAGDVVEVNQ